MEYYKANGLEVKSVQEFGSKLEETGKALNSLSDEQYENAQLASLSNYILVYY